MWQEADSVVRAELGPQEKLLWSGQPRSGIRLRSSDVLMIPFSLMWGGFAIFWEIMALTIPSKAGSKAGPIALVFPLWGIPFVLVGLYMIFGRFLVDAKMRKRTYYGLTNERIVIVSGLFERKTKSLSLRTLTDVSLSQKPDGSGTITFGPSEAFMAQLNVMPWAGARQSVSPSFDMIEGAKQVYESIRQAQVVAA